MHPLLKMNFRLHYFHYSIWSHSIDPVTLRLPTGQNAHSDILTSFHYNGCTNNHYPYIYLLYFHYLQTLLPDSSFLSLAYRKQRSIIPLSLQLLVFYRFSYVSSYMPSFCLFYDIPHKKDPSYPNESLSIFSGQASVSYRTRLPPDFLCSVSH